MTTVQTEESPSTEERLDYLNEGIYPTEERVSRLEGAYPSLAAKAYAAEAEARLIQRIGEVRTEVAESEAHAAQRFAESEARNAQWFAELRAEISAITVIGRVFS